MLIFKIFQKFELLFLQLKSIKLELKVMVSKNITVKSKIFLALIAQHLTKVYINLNN